MRKIFEAADAQPDADDICFVSDGCTALQIAALYPPLTEQEEQELLSTKGTPGWESARERLVLCNLRLVMWVANRYPESGGFTTEDLIEYGIVGLMLGIDRYQASQETKLSTYVIPWIQKTIREQVMLRQGLITVPAHMAGQVAKLQKERHRMIAEGILEPSMEELMIRSGIDPSMSEQLQSAMEASMCGSLDTPVASGSSRGSSDTATTVGDFIADQKKSTEETAVDAAMVADILRYMECFADSEQRVVRLRLGIDDGVQKTFQECGEILGCTAECCRQMYLRAIRKLQTAFAPASIADA